MPLTSVSGPPLAQLSPRPICPEQMGTGDSLPEGGAPGMAHISNDRCQALSNCARHNRFYGSPLTRSRPLMAQRLGVSAPLAEITIIGSVEQLANQVWWLSANPVFSSAAQPIRLFGYTKHFVSLKGTWSRITK